MSEIALAVCILFSSVYFYFEYASLLLVRELTVLMRECSVSNAEGSHISVVLVLSALLLHYMLGYSVVLFMLDSMCSCDSYHAFFNIFPGSFCTRFY